MSRIKNRKAKEKSERNVKEIILYIVAVIMAIYTIAKAYSAIKQMITYCSAYGISITSKLFVVIVYVIEVCLPYISLAVLFFLFAKMYKKFRLLEERINSIGDIKNEYVKVIHEEEVAEDAAEVVEEVKEGIAEESLEENSALTEEASAEDESETVSE